FVTLNRDSAAILRSAGAAELRPVWHRTAAAASAATQSAGPVTSRGIFAIASASLEQDPEKWGTGFRKRSCSSKKLERDDDSKKSHPALVPRTRSSHTSCGKCDCELRVQKRH